MELINANNPKNEEERKIINVIENSIDKFQLEQAKETLQQIIDKQIYIDTRPDNTTINAYEAIEIVLNYIKNSIPKKKIEDKIEEHIDYLNNQAVTSNPKLDAHFREKERYIITILKELLEE